MFENIFSSWLRENFAERCLTLLCACKFFFESFSQFTFIHVHSHVTVTEISDCKRLCFLYRRRAVGIFEKKTPGINDRNITIEESFGTLDGDFHQRPQQLRWLLHDPQWHAAARVFKLVDEAQKREFYWRFNNVNVVQISRRCSRCLMK